MNTITNAIFGTFFDQIHSKYISVQNNRSRQSEIDKFKSYLRFWMDLRAQQGKDSFDQYIGDWGTPDCPYKIIKATNPDDINDVCKEFMNEGFGVSYYKRTHKLLFAWDNKYNQTEVRIIDD